MTPARKNRKRIPTPDAKPDPRLHARRIQSVTSPTGETIPQTNAWVTLVQTVRLEDGRVLWFPSQDTVVFYLLGARQHLQEAERLRQRVLKMIRARPEGDFQPTGAKEVLDCLAGLTKAVQLSFAAVEALANLSIDALPEGA